uniref:Zf-met2 domain-containing protein n=1 Tax=Heterorhabditis bacteriophora TaxID=37862 RepID=A0A1I7XVR0_HETBA
MDLHCGQVHPQLKEHAKSNHRLKHAMVELRKQAEDVKAQKKTCIYSGDQNYWQQIAPSAVIGLSIITRF